MSVWREINKVSDVRENELLQLRPILLDLVMPCYTGMLFNLISVFITSIVSNTLFQAWAGDGFVMRKALPATKSPLPLWQGIFGLVWPLRRVPRVSHWLRNFHKVDGVPVLLRDYCLNMENIDSGAMTGIFPCKLTRSRLFLQMQFMWKINSSCS